MFKKLLILFRIGRKLSSSGAISSIYEIYNPPIGIKTLFFIIGFNIHKKKVDDSLSVEKKLCNALQEMGTTFIKLGQFLATRPDIIGEELSKKLENLQDKLPPFSINKAKEIIKSDLGDETFNSIIDLSEPVAAASKAQAPSLPRRKVNRGPRCRCHTLHSSESLNPSVPSARIDFA